MANNISWKTFFAGVGSAIVVIAALIGAINVVKNWSSCPKPQILDAQNCFVSIPDAGEGKEIRFELLVNNPSSKDCSIISIDLTWPDGLNADLEWGELSTFLPITIPAHRTERIKIGGLDHKWHELNPNTLGGELIPEGKLELQPNQKSVEAEAVVKFNTGQIIKKSIAFAIKRP